MYALHPGWVTSKYDLDRHFIRSVDLISLYKIRAEDAIVWPEKGRFGENCLGRIWDDYIHLYPQYNGDYSIPEGKAIIGSVKRPRFKRRIKRAEK